MLLVPRTLTDCPTVDLSFEQQYKGKAADAISRTVWLIFWVYGSWNLSVSPSLTLSTRSRQTHYQQVTILRRTSKKERLVYQLWWRYNVLTPYLLRSSDLYPDLYHWVYSAVAAAGQQELQLFNCQRDCRPPWQPKLKADVCCSNPPPSHKKKNCCVKEIFLTLCTVTFVIVIK